MTAGFDLQKQRATLEQLRREVEALDEATECSSPLGLRPDQKSSASFPFRTLADKTEEAAMRLDERMEAIITESQAQLNSLSVESDAMKAEVSSREAILAQAKSEWSRSLSHAAAVEGREERRLNTARKEFEEVHSEELHQEAAHRMERDRLRHRHRNLRMQLRQAERQTQQVEQTESLGCEFVEDHRHVIYNSAEDMDISPAAASTAVPHGLDRGRSCSPGVHRSRKAKLETARHNLGATQAAVLQLRQRQEALVEGQQELSERESGLRRASRLSDREVEHLRRRSELRAEEASLQEEQTNFRAELKEVCSEAEAAQRETGKQRNAQERLAQELSERGAHFHEQESVASQALGTIEEYLASNGGSLSSEERQAHLAEWLEADICTRQVERVKRRLSEIVADAGARAQVLEQAVAELHADLDRRAAIILELVERRNACIKEAERSPNRSHAGKGAADTLGVVGYGSSSDEDEPTSRQQTDDKASDKEQVHEVAQGANGQLDKKALEDELEHQRGLFELRGEQVQGLEQRLAALLAREAPRVYALRAWIAVHETISQDCLQACLLTAAGSNALRADVEAMQRDKSMQLAEAEAEWNMQRYHLTEAANAARQNADHAMSRVTAIQKKRQGLLKGLDRVLKAEARLTSKVSTACDAVDRDQRRLVDLTARQIRASSAMSRRDQPGTKVDHTQRGEAARQALQDARKLVETTRMQQAEVLLGLVQENVHVGAEIKRVGEALEQAVVREESARLAVAELEHETVGCAEASARSSPSRPARRDSSRGPSNAPHTGRDVSRGASSGPQRGQGMRVQLDRRRARLEDDLRSTVEQLRKVELRFEESERLQRGQKQKAEEKMEEMQREFENERAKQRSSVASFLKRYRSTQASAADAAQALGDICAKTDVIAHELSDARSALRRDRERRQKKYVLENKMAQGHAAPSQGPGGIFDLRAGVERGNGVAGSGSSGSTKQGGPELRSGRSPRAVKKDASAMSPAVTSRTVPSVLEIRQRCDMDGHPELQSFYLQVFPLLKGTHVAVFRKNSKRFEARQLLLTSDLQRLEIWPPPSPSSASSSSANGPSGGTATPPPPNSRPARPPSCGTTTPPPPNSRNRARLPESFIRVEAITRLHVPKATLAAVQRAILSSTHSEKDLQSPSLGELNAKDAMGKSQDCAQLGAFNLDFLSAEVAQAVEDWTRGTGAHRGFDTSSAGESISGSPRSLAASRSGSRPGMSVGSGTIGANVANAGADDDIDDVASENFRYLRSMAASRSGSRPGMSVGSGTVGTSAAGAQALLFELMMAGADPWRFMADDVHSFHLATAAIGALLTSRASLQSYAVALSLGATSQHPQVIA